MNLTIRERVELFGILPTQGSFGTLRTVRKIREALEFTEEEAKAIGLTVQEIPNPVTGQVFTQTRWDPAHAQDTFDVKFNSASTVYLQGVLARLSKEEKLPDTLFGVAEQLLGNEEG